MSALRKPFSTWIETLDLQISRSKHVLIHGQTLDLALYAGREDQPKPKRLIHMTFDSALHQYLADAGFAVVLHFNPTDGLQLANPAMSDAYCRAWAGLVPVQQGASHLDQQGASPLNRLNVPGDTAGALQTIHGMVRQTVVPVAVVISFFDKITADPEHHAADEVNWLVRLNQIFRDASFASKQSAPGLRNTVIGVATRLTNVPSWLYVDNPRLSMVTVGKPNSRERRHWIETRLSEFHGITNEVSPERRKALVEELAISTEGMSNYDISLLPRISCAEKIGLESATELVRAARYGKKEDPWRDLDRTRLVAAEPLLSKRVMGQEAAVAHVVAALQRAWVGIGLGGARARGGPPKGVFFFVGPTGVGKTELSKALAEWVFGDDDRLKVFDMAEYGAKEAGERLAGSPPGYVGYERGGQLTNHVLADPFTVILFDEFEKADSSVYDKFLGILEEGRLTDGRGMTANFDQAMLVFTSNIGSGPLMKRLGDVSAELPSYEEVRSLYLKAVRDYFAIDLKRPELLGRFGENIIVFDLLRPALVVQLCHKLLGELRDNAMRERRIVLAIDEAGITKWLGGQMRKPENLEKGGRGLRELVEAAIVRPLCTYVSAENVARDERLRVSVSSDGSRIVITRA